MVVRVFTISFLLAVSAIAAAAADTSGKAAEVNGTVISAAEVDAKLGNDLAQLQEQMYDLRRKQLDSIIDQKLLEAEAAKRGVAVPALIEQQITSKVTQPTAEDAEKFYKENASRIKADFKSIEDQIKSYLTTQRTQSRQKEYLQSLRQAAKVSVFLARPPVFRSEVSTTGAPVRGNASAPVTIVEFSDFHCPFCRRAQPVLEQLRAKYGPKVKFVYLDFPLDALHPQARAASEASACAGEQGKFWEYHDRLFKDDPVTTEEGLQKAAAEVGLNADTFKACIASGRHKKAIEASIAEGTRLGVTATPTFFVNGRILMGAQPAEEFIRVIDEELSTAGKGQ